MPRKAVATDALRLLFQLLYSPFSVCPGASCAVYQRYQDAQQAEEDDHRRVVSQLGGHQLRRRIKDANDAGPRGKGIDRSTR